jgi:hypothetical protein
LRQSKTWWMHSFISALEQMRADIAFECRLRDGITAARSSAGILFEIPPC